MSASTDFVDHVLELLAGLGPVHARRMFGGAGLYADGVMFALVIDDVLYFKADETTRQRFSDEGSEPFTYEAKGRTITVSHWRVPDRLYDDADEMCCWARTALAIARKAQARKAAPTKKKAGAPRRAPAKSKQQRQ